MASKRIWVVTKFHNPGWGSRINNQDVHKFTDIYTDREQLNEYLRSEFGVLFKPRKFKCKETGRMVSSYGGNVITINVITTVVGGK